MPISIRLRNGDQIVGHHAGSQVPPGNVEITDAQFADLQAAQATLRAARREDFPEWTGAAIVVPPDTRNVFGIVSDRAQEQIRPGVQAVPLLADGVDSVTLTITAYESDGVTVRTALNGARWYEVDTETWWRVTFVAGVATKVLTTTTLGFRTLQSNGRSRLLVEGQVLAHE